jgi:hypothetical protein
MRYKGFTEIQELVSYLYQNGIILKDFTHLSNTEITPVILT